MNDDTAPSPLSPEAVEEAGAIADRLREAVGRAVRIMSTTSS